MKKRILSLLMSFVMLVSLLPASVLAAETVREISSAREFAEMNASGSYKLTQDIEVTTPYKSTFNGTFDGDGHTVTLKLNVTSGNAGLFATTGQGAVIKNVEVSADVTSNVASSSYGTAGLVGKVSGATTITNCGVTGTVSNTATTTYYAARIGSLVGYFGGALTLNDCYSTANISSKSTYSSSAAGGLIGGSGSAYPITAENCYFSGNVDAKNYAGGFIGYLNSSASKPHAYTNCYTSGNVTGSPGKAYAFAYVYKSFYGSAPQYAFDNCYFNDANTDGGCNLDSTGLTAKTSDELKDLAGTLGSGFRADLDEPINNGYPILSWQYIDPTKTHTVSFNVEPKDSVLTWNDEVQPVSTNGKYEFADVAVGSYGYSVSNEAGDYAAKSGTVTVKNKNVTVPVTLELNKHTLTFALTPADAELTVKSGDDTLTPNSDGSYSVVNGTYSYTASKFGYETAEDTVTVDRADKEQSVTMTKAPSATVRFVYAEDAAPTIKVTYYDSAKYKTITMTPEADGSYQLPIGYEYNWEFDSAVYIAQSGTIDLTKAQKGDTKDITVPMFKKPTGTGTVEDPYLISNTSQLRWFASQVNDNGKNSICAQLTNDIDLGNENWTPIGQYARNAYNGTFDGQYHEIQNLKITGSASNHYGLFGVVGTGTVKNLTVSGAVTISGSGYSSYGIAAIAGSLNSTGTIENCINKATVTGNYNTAGIVGYMSNSNGTVTSCVNTGNISGSNSVGGIVGQFYGKGTVAHCYNTGDITAAVSKAGGIVGYLYVSSSYYKNTVASCYSTGKVSGNSSAAVVGSIYNTSYSTLDKLFFLEGESRTDSNAESKTSDELKALAPKLGGAFIKNSAGINDGYPIFRWQIPTYAVTFTVDPADAEVTIDGQTGTHSGSNWTFALPDGEYSYTVTAFGYEEQTGNVTVKGGAVHETVKLAAAEKHTVTFDITFDIAPADPNAVVTVTWNGSAIEAEADGSYLLPDGEYTYTVKAKGYAKVSEPLTVSRAEVVSVTLTHSTAWDGTTKAQPTGDGTQAAPYQIENGEHLAWLADKVNNASTVSAIYAVLTDDIDLGGCSFTPIGKDFHEFSGSFDGQGHTISGLNVSGVNDAGFFGVAKAATIKNIIVQGTVSGTDNAAGILAKAKTTACSIENCGNEATVTSTGYAGGILGTIGTYGVSCSISGCYNTSPVTSTGSSSSGRAAGIIGYDNGKTPVTDCYNTGNITASSGYAGGIRGVGSSMVGTITGCYNAGAVTGSSTSNTGAIAPGNSSVLDNCHYLNIVNDNNTNGATALTLAEMQSKLLDKDKLGTENWTSVRGVNNSLPVLKWQKVSAPTAKVTLVSDAAFVRSIITTEDGDETSLPTAQLQWTPVTGAESYTVSLWRAEKTWVPLTAEEKAEYDAISSETSDFPNLEKLEYVNETAVISRMNAEQKARLAALDAAVDEAESDPEQTDALYDAMENRAAFIVSLAKDSDLGSYTSQLAFAQDISGITKKTWYDLTSAFAALPEGIYYAAVAVETDGQAAYVSSAQVNNEVVGIQSPYNRMKTVTGVEWDGATAKWDGRENFTGTYQIDLYTVENSDYTLFKTFTVSGRYTSANFANVFAAEKRYSFTVTAIADSTIDRELGLTDSIPSAYSGVYDPSESTEDSSKKEWVDIGSAEEWVKLANVKDEPSAGTDSPNKQAIEWSKNYRLTADIDFSKLSAADQTKTKSIGTVTYPFMGEFDGQGHKITGLTLSNSDSGLFWYIGATGYVHDLTIDSANVLFSDNAAVLVHNNYGRLEKCAVVNTNITADTGAVLGGMVSRNYGTIRDSYVEGGTLTSNTTTAVGHAGFVGANETGGLIERCWTSMNVSTQSAHAAGFVGLGYGGTIKNCFALGNVSARGYSGGFVGRSVYQGNVYENCYAAGVVTVTEKEGNGFIGGNQSSSAFQYDQSEGIKNCYYNSATASSHDYNATGKSLDEMKADTFLTALSGSAAGVWTQDADHNNGLPYLSGVKVPETAKTTQITVNIAVATYNKDTYSFEKSGDVISVTMDSNGNTRLVDLMDAAQAQGKLTYSYSTTSTFGRFIHTINGREVNEPDGWMFTVNDVLSNVSASLATVKDGDNILWFEGTTENHFQGPTWASLSGESIQWEIISTKKELLALANVKDAETLSKNYKLTADLDLSGETFPGIGTATHPFTGRFDGQNHTISNVNVTVSGTDSVGFFGVIKGAKIQNLNLKNVNISGKERVGGLVGYAQAALDKDDLSQNVANLIGGCTVSGTVTGSNQVGGLVGLNEGKTNPDTLFSIASTIDKSSADVTVTGNEKTGGLVGENTGTITKSAATGAVTGTTMTGGFAGSSSGDIYDSHAKGAVTGNNHTGGFAGSSTGTVKNCYSLGAVTGTDYTGSFAGSLAKADTVVGAGQVTITGTPAQGYNGGLAGSLSGIVSGPANQITVKNAFGNCIQTDGTKLSVIGNTTAYPSDTLKGMTLSTRQEVGDKLYELFRVNLPDLKNEADQYVDALTVPAGTATGTELSLLKSSQSPAPGVTVTYSVTDAHLTGGKTLTLAKGNDTVSTISVSVQLRLADTFGSYHKTVQVILPVTPEKRTELMDAIASGCIDTKDAWTAMDMAVYSALPGKTAKLADAAKQNILNLLIKEANSRKATLSDHSRIEIVLRSLGIDSRKLYPVNSNAAVDNAAKLTQMAAQADPYAAPYVLLADLQGNVGLTAEQVNTLIGVLKANMGTGLFSYERNGVTYASPDTAGAALAALAKYYDTNADAEMVADAILKALPGAMNEAGSFGSANSDAMVMIGLLALGKDPAALTSVSGASVVDGMLSYVNTGTNQFRYSGEDNALATEQAFRALAALAHFEKGKAFNVYDFSANPVEPGRATGSGSTESPAEPTGTEITVRMTIKADSGYWFNGSVTIRGEGATVYHALIEALAEAGMSQVGAESGYVRSISKDGKTLSEFDNGENSGWLYKVNGDLPDVGLTSYAIKDGDRIVWYYTDDWTLDPDAGKWYVKPISSTITPAAAIKDGIASASVSYKDLSEAISAAKKSGEDTVTITPEIKGKVNGIAVSLPKSAAANAAKQGMKLVVETDKARVSLRAEVLGELAKNSGSELKLEITEKRAEEVSYKLAHENLDGASIVEVTLMIDGKPVTVFGGKKLLIDIPVDSKRFRAGDTCRVLVLSDDGAAERTSGQCIKKNDALFVRVETTHLSIFVVMRDAALPFTDVADTAWYADAVQYAYERGLMTGVSESEFAPNGTATRGQIVTILWRLAGSPVVNYAMRYADMDEGAWYGEAVRWAASTGVVTGYTESSFGPNDAITREQLAAILYRYVKTQGQGFTGMWYFPLRYDDAASISSWADEAMHWCVMKGLLNGTSETTLSPQLTATRAQLAAILQRFCELPKDTASKSAAQTAYDRASTYLTAAVSAPRYGSLGGEWTVLALARGGADTETAYFTDYYAALEQTVREANGVLSERKYTEYSRVILALSALGKDARDVAGFDLTLPLGDYEKTAAQGVNGAIYALLALDSRDYPMPQNAAASTQATRQLYVDAILAAQLTNGGWSFMGEDADPDLTAMALQALAKYREQSSVQLAANRALVCLSAMQNADGGFSSWGSENAESCAQVLLALNALGLDADDSRFVKNGHSALDALLTYQNADGGFCHERGGETNLMASEQAACALASLVRAERGESGLYRMAALMQPAA